MALDSHDSESLLPSLQFLSHDVILSENQKINRYRSPTPDSVLNGIGSCGSSSSCLSTPGESELGLTEAESDDDDFVAELTQQMADYMLQEDDEKTAPNCYSANSKRLNISNSCKPSSVPAHAKDTDFGFYSNKPFTDDQIGANRFHQLKNQQLMQQQSSVFWGRRGKMTESTQQLQNRNQHNYVEMSPAFASSRIRSPFQQQAGSGMRAIFLKGSGSRSGSTGTGVFLPRGTGNPAQSRNKKGCSTVLIPARVVKALQLHFDSVNALSPSNGCDAFSAGHSQSDVTKARSNNMHSEENRQSESTVLNHHELGLPQEWTY